MQPRERFVLVGTKKVASQPPDVGEWYAQEAAEEQLASSDSP